MKKVVIADINLLCWFTRWAEPIIAGNLPVKCCTTRLMLYEASQRARQVGINFSIPDCVEVQSFGQPKMKALFEFNASEASNGLSLAENSALYYAKECGYKLLTHETLTIARAKSLGITTYSVTQILHSTYGDLNSMDMFNPPILKDEGIRFDQQRGAASYRLSI